MKDFFEEYLAIPLCCLLMFFIAPTVFFGGIKLAIEVLNLAPPTSCEVRNE
jgi:hypothetical protein